MTPHQTAYRGKTERSGIGDCTRGILAPTWLAVLVAVTLLVLCGSGCQGQQLLTADSAGDDLSRYADLASRTEFSPAADTAITGQLSPEPLRMRQVRDLQQLRDEDFRRVTLAEVLSTTLANSKLIRNRYDFLSNSNGLYNNSEQMPSALDVDIQQTGGSGIDAALSAFDTQLATGAQWGQNALVQNAGMSTGAFPRSDLLVNDSGSIFARIDKPLSTGSLVSLVHNWNYSLNNLPQQSFNTRYAGFLRAELRHPLWAGKGSDFANIAGPTRYGNATLGQGMALAEVDGVLAQTKVQLQLQTHLKQTEELYWELWLAIQNYRSQTASRDSAHRLWQKVQSRAKAGLDGGNAADEAQAEESFLDRQNSVHGAITEVFEAEGRLRRMIGLAVNDGQLLWPVEQPMLAEFVPNWEDSLQECYAYRLELVQQKLRIQNLELQLRAAKSLANPQLDLVSGAQLNGFGNELIDGSTGSPGAYESILDPDQAGWNVGFEFSMPMGFRLANARVRNLQYRVAKARAVMQAQETEIGHELSHAFRELDKWYAAVQTSAKLQQVALKRLQAVEADYDAGRASLDLLVRAQLGLSQAECGAAQSVAGYNRALLDLQFRKGMLLSQQHLQPLATAPPIAEAAPGG